MKKVLHIPNYFYPHIGGIEQVTRDCVNSLKGICDQRIICFNSEKKTSYDVVDGIPVTRVGKNAEIFSQSICLSYKKELKKLFNEYRPDVVIFHYPNPYVAHYLIPLIKKSKAKFILYWHLDIVKQKILGKLFDGQNKRLLKLADTIVATSPNYVDGSKYLSKYKSKCIVVNNCINERRLQVNDNVLTMANSIKDKYKDEQILFAFGRHVKYKGLEYLVEASRYLPSNVKVLIGGKGPLTDKLKSNAKGMDNIEFLGVLTDDEVKANLTACDVFCFPSISKNEAFGLGLAEAMYFGKPSATFTIEGSGVNYVSLDSVTGIETHHLDAKEYADNIKEMLSDEGMRTQMGINAKERVQNLFTYKKYEQSIQELFKNI